MPPSTDTEEIYKLLSTKKNGIISRYPNIRDLGRKDVLKSMMSVVSDINAAACDFIPPSFNFPEDKDKFIQYDKTHKNATYIAKPQAGCQGDNIYLFKDLH